MSSNIFCNTFRAITCNAFSAGDGSWEEMEDKLQRHGQAHVLRPPPPAERKAAFLEQLQSVGGGDNIRTVYTLFTNFERFPYS